MQKVMSYIRNYYGITAVIIMISAILSYSLSYFFVTSENHKAAEMYIGELKYSVTLDSIVTNSIAISPGEHLFMVNVKNLNNVATKYKLVYESNPNLNVVYYPTTEDAAGVVKTYSKSADSIALNTTNNVKVKVENKATTNQTISFKAIGGYDINDVSTITVPSGYTAILSETDKYYFCYTGKLLKNGLTYSSGQYEYKYRYGATTPLRSGFTTWDSNLLEEAGWGVQAVNPKNITDVLNGKICSYIDDRPIVSMQYMYASRKDDTINIKNFRSNSVTSMEGMFSGAKANNMIGLANLNTSSVKNMSTVFYNTNVKSISGLTSWDTSNVTDMSGMFRNAVVTELDLSGFNTSKVTDMGSMFDRTSLKLTTEITINGLTSFDTSNVIDMSNMFSNINTTTLDLSSFTINESATLTMMFSNTTATTVYVKDELTAKLFNTISSGSLNFTVK